MSASVAASVVGIAVGIKSLTSSPGQSQQQAQQAVDPFASHRGKLGDMYSASLQQGSTTDITKMPGYSQFKSGVMDPALEASKRTSAASGMMRSGNEQIALQDTAQKGYYGFMQDYMNRLATGSGAGYAPAQGGVAGLQAQQQAQQAQMQGIGGILQGSASLYNAYQGGSGTSTVNSTGGAAGYGITADQYAGYYGGQ